MIRRLTALGVACALAACSAGVIAVSPSSPAGSAVSSRALPTPVPSTTVRPAAVPPIAPGNAPTGATTTARVLSITDGDTIRVEINGDSIPARYIGIDSPETHSPTEPVQWLGPEATTANAALVAGQTVVLERDVSDTDRFDRLLRYVWLEQGGQWLLVNRELVRLGFATAKAYPPDTRYQGLLDAAQADARQATGRPVERDAGPDPAAGP